MTTILLLDMRRLGDESEVVQVLRREASTHVSRSQDIEQICKDIRAVKPDILCFEFDYPDVAGLGALSQTKLRYPRIPILMITLRSSEALALWAFRSGVRDYIRKPVIEGTLLERLHCLMRSLKYSQLDQQRRPFIFSAPIPENVPARHAPLTSLLEGVLPYIEQHFDERISQREIAESLGLSTYQFSRLFKRMSGTTFQEHLARRRIDAATMLLSERGLTVTDVCYAVGFNDVSHFTRTFRRQLGVAPSQYRANQLGLGNASLTQTNGRALARAARPVGLNPGIEEMPLRQEALDIAIRQCRSEGPPPNHARELRWGSDHSY